MENEEDYEFKAEAIFKMINDFRRDPKSLAKHLEKMKIYLDRQSNILSVPNKIQVQMVEGESVFNEAIAYLKNLPSVKPLEWDDNLTLSALAHANDIGPKGLLLYQSSDGTEPKDRISKYGNFIDSLGENIDFGPNDAFGVILSLVLDDGEIDRPHRENIFKNDYHKVGIACGPHKSEFQMCVMDFAFDFTPLESTTTIDNSLKGKKKEENNLYTNSQGKNIPNKSKHQQFKGKDSSNKKKMKDIGSQQNDDVPLNAQQQQQQKFINQSPYEKISLEKNDFNSMKLNKMVNSIEEEDINAITTEMLTMNNSYKRAIKKNIEVITRITYTYDDGTTREIQDKKLRCYDI